MKHKPIFKILKSRLSTTQASGGSYGTYSQQTYTYSSSTGNPTNKKVGRLSNKAGVSYTYGDTSHKHAVTSTGSDTYTYDADGNQITRNVGGSSYTLSYDAENRLVGVAGAVTASFVYDGDGNRVKGTVNGTTTAYLGEYFEWTGSTSSMKKYYFAGSTRVAMRTGSTLRFLLGDHLGGMSISTNSNGVFDAELRYMPWGERRYYSGSIPTNYQFTDQRIESNLGWYFYNSRWYDPATGRFMQPDTVVPGGVQGLDRYAYVGNNPVKYTDPRGHVRCDADGYCGDDPNHPTNTTWIWYTQQMHDKYGWEEKGKWTYQEYRTLYNAGTKIENYINGIGGSGQEWIRENLGNTTFYRTQSAQVTNSMLGIFDRVPGPKPGSTPWNNGINLSAGFGDYVVIHELGHRWDNSSKSGVCPATWCGGGIADKLVTDIGGDPRGIRWHNGNNEIPSEYQWSNLVMDGYGNSSSAEYFAESFVWLVINPTQLPPTVENWMNQEILK
jgi:RHS repeat-associated protein